MAEVKERKQPGSEQSERQEGKHRRGGGLIRWSDPSPSLWRSPGEFFSLSPFSLMRRFTDEMDRLFSGFGRFGTAEAEPWAPAVEVTERDGKLIVSAELPGLKQDDVKVEVTDEGLCIEGERKREREERRGAYYRSERSYGHFYRCIPLPEGANVEEARAQFNNGVLEVSIPIPESASRRRQIPISEAGPERKQVSAETAGERKEAKTG